MSSALDHPQQPSNAPPEQPKRLACERCRGQKLRCIRNRIHQLSCNRCERAGADCITKPSMRMGRPGRSEGQRRESSGVRKRRQSLVVSCQQLDYGSNATMTTSVDTFDISPIHDSSALGHQGIDISGTGLVPHLLSTGVLEAQQGDFIPFPFIDEIEKRDIEAEPMPWLGYNAIDVGPSQFADPNDAFRTSFGPSEHGVLGHSMGNIDSQLSPGPTYPPELGFQRVTDDFTDLTTRPAIKPENGNLLEVNSLYSGSMDRLARLATDVNQQLELDRRTNRASNNHNITGIPFLEPVLPIAGAIHCLQGFQDLLHDLASLQMARSMCEAEAEHQGLSRVGNEMYEPSPQESAHSLATSSTPSSCSDESLLPIRFNGCSTVDAQASRQSQLDVPTSLSLLICYINLIRLSRIVISGIHSCLIALNHRTISIALSGIQISGVSLQGDQDLQILVLVQVLVRMVDSIGELLGRRGSNIGGQREDQGVYPLVSPTLLEIVMGEEERNRHDSQAGGIEALREDIRKLRRGLTQS